MATQANEYFVITDGTTTCTFSDGATPAGNTDYRLIDGWTPAVAHLSDSQLGGRGPYEDVTEKPDIVVKGATWTAAKANVAALERLMQQAVRWARGENVSVVLVKWAPKGSTVATTAAPFQSVILGGEFAFSAKWHQDQATFQTNGKLTFQRRGAWLLAAAVTGSSASTPNPGPFSVTGMANISNISPAQVKLAGFTSGTHMDFTDSLPILLTAFQAADLVLAEAEQLTATAYTKVADVANLAHAGSVLRYTPTGTTEATGPLITLSGYNSASRRVAVFAALRNNSATTTWKIRMVAEVNLETSSGAVGGISATPYVTIDTAHARPRFVPMGIISFQGALQGFGVAITASSPSGTLDIDYVVALAADSPYSRALQLGANAFNGGTWDFGAANDLFIDPQALTSLAPIAYRNKQGTSDFDYLGYYGDAYPVAGSTTFAALFMGKTAASTADWCYRNGASAGSLTLTASRYDARVSPE